MRTFDLTPLFRSTVGFDRMSRTLDQALRLDESALSYPPYNIERVSESDYRITMAVAGFGADDLEISTHEGTLTIKGRTTQTGDDRTYLYRGIAGRAFERKFQLADYIEVAGARLENGLLHVDLHREVPEALKPRTIAISAPDGAERIEQKAAA